MKHVCILIFLVSQFTSVKIFSQSFQGGLKAGMIASEISGDRLAGPRKIGPFASVFTFYNLSEFSSLQLEIKYIEKGSRSVPAEENNFNEYRLALQYVEVPLYYNINIARYTSLSYFEKLWVNMGLSFSSLVGHYEQDEFGADISAMRADEFKRWEGNIWLGVSYPVTASLDFVFAYSNSLTAVRPHVSGARRWYNTGQYHSLWLFGLSYVIW